MTDKETIKRLEDIEVRFAFQAETVEDLSNTVAKQWNEIDILKKQIKILKTQIIDLKENKDQNPEDVPPPHY